MTSTRIISKLLAQLALTGSAIAVASSATAQGSYQYDNRSYQSNGYVTVYRDCEFKGESRQISVGDYRNMGVFDFSNDSISSMRVPRGLEVIIFKDDKFRGDYANVDRDIYCLDDRWNDEISSLQVKSTYNNGVGRNDNRNNREPRFNDRRDDRSYRNDQRGSDYRQNNRNPNSRVTGAAQSRVTAKNLAQIVFANRVLRQTAPKQWQIADSRLGVSQYRELSRDSNSVYLQNDYTAERVRIDLFTNDVTFIKRNGQRNSYPITDKRASAARGLASGQTRSVNRAIKGNCFNYKAYTRGGAGGIRFHGHDGFTRFRSKPHTGRICHSGDLTMELNKTLPATEVVVEIQGNKYRFGKNEKEDVLKNTWYRKKINLSVAR